jgi:hypothetical protein
VGWWRFDECQGTTAYDASGNGNNGSINIGATAPQTSAGTCTDGLSTSAWYNGATGKYNSSLNFDGTDDYVEIADNTQTDMGTSDMTIYAWFKTTASGCGLLRDSPSWYSGWWIDMRSTGKVWAKLGDSSSSISTPDSSAGYNDGNWHNIVTVFDRDANMTVYVDGLSVTSANISTYNGTNIDNTSSTKIGWAYTNYCNGQIDDVRIYNYALTAEQVKALYNEGSAVRFGPSSGSP